MSGFVPFPRFDGWKEVRDLGGEPPLPVTCIGVWFVLFLFWICGGLRPAAVVIAPLPAPLPVLQEPPAAEPAAPATQAKLPNPWIHSTLWGGGGCWTPGG